MIFPEIAFLWNVREGFEPSTSGQFMCTLLYHWATTHHAPIIWLSTQNQMQEPLVKTCRKYSMWQAARLAYITFLFPSLSHYSSSFFRRNQIIKDVNLILELLRQWIGGIWYPHGYILRRYYFWLQIFPCLSLGNTLNNLASLLSSTSDTIHLIP